MFSNKEILRIALEQSAIDSNCKWDDFLKKENVTVISAANPAARRYLKLPHVCDLTSYGDNIVATIIISTLYFLKQLYRSYNYLKFLKLNKFIVRNINLNILVF